MALEVGFNVIFELSGFDLLCETSFNVSLLV